MSFWKYLREFLIFRWLFGSHRHEEASHRASSGGDSYSGGDRYVDCDCDYDCSCDYDHHGHHVYSQSCDDLIEDPEDLDDHASRYGGQDYYDFMYGVHDDYGSSYGGYDDYGDGGLDDFDEFDSGDDW